MWINITNWFTKITGWLPSKIVFRTRIHYEDRSIQGRRIKGSAILISNHTSVFDYAAYLFVFFNRTLRFQMAEVLFKKKPLGLFLKMLGGIYVNRESHDFSFVAKSEKILSKGGVVGIFPESRLAKPGEKRPLPFKPSAAYIALSTGVKVIPAYTDGNYFNRKKNHIMVGTPIDVTVYANPNLSDKENMEVITKKLRERIIELGRELDGRIKKG